MWLLDRAYKRNWFSKASLKVALQATRQKSTPTSHAAFMWLIENIKGSPVICQSGPQSPPEGQVNVFISGLQGRNGHRVVKRLAPGLGWTEVELGLRKPGSCLWFPRSAHQASHPLLRQLLSLTIRSEIHWEKRKFPWVSGAGQAIAILDEIWSYLFLFSSHGGSKAFKGSLVNFWMHNTSPFYLSHSASQVKISFLLLILWKYTDWSSLFQL